VSETGALREKKGEHVPGVGLNLLNLEGNEWREPEARMHRIRKDSPKHIEQNHQEILRMLRSRGRLGGRRCGHSEWLGTPTGFQQLVKRTSKVTQIKRLLILLEPLANVALEPLARLPAFV